MKTIRVRYGVYKNWSGDGAIREDSQVFSISEENYEELFEWESEKRKNAPFAYKALRFVIMNIAVLQGFYGKFHIFEIEGESEIKTIDPRICPVCGKTYFERPALSRRDNETNICPDCGMREAKEI